MRWSLWGPNHPEPPGRNEPNAAERSAAGAGGEAGEIGATRLADHERGLRCGKVREAHRKLSTKMPMTGTKWCEHADLRVMEPSA